jgi:hypothetical protein
MRTVLPSKVVHCSVLGAVFGCQPAQNSKPLKHSVAMLHRIIAITDFLKYPNRSEIPANFPKIAEFAVRFWGRFES